jgi:predicted O-methyltransferase YrrM
MQQAPVPLNEEEKKILDILEDMNRNQSSGMMNVPTLDGRILRLLTETTNAKNIVEIGTSNGYSGIWFCLGLKATGGKLTTHDIDEGRAALARENFKRAGVDNLVTLVMGDAHETVKKLKDPIDILFIDADKEGYTDYLEKLLPLVRPGGLILAHNIDQVGQDFINAITTNPNLETIQLEGVTITLKKRLSEKSEETSTVD